MSRTLKGTVIIGLSAIALTTYVHTKQSIPPLTPLSSTPINISFSHPSDRILFGFLPYWNSSSFNPESLQYLTDIAYFSLTAQADGSIKTHQQPTQLDPGWNNFSKSSTQQLLQTAKQNNLRTHLTITLLKKEPLEVLLADTVATQKLTQEIISVQQEYQFDGINIDFEPESPVSQTTREQFTTFIAGLRQAAGDHELILSVDVYPSAASRPNLWDISQLEPHLDYLIVMAYDYTQRNTTHAGPIAPLYSNTDSNIMRHLQEITQHIEPQKIVLGIPVYGYQWQTTKEEVISPVFPNTSQLITHKNFPQRIGQHQVYWDSQHASTWITSTNDQGGKMQTYLESPASIQLKSQLVMQAQLGGVAYWALGYESPDMYLYRIFSQEK